ncbi:MAG: hypothetical protein ABI969_02460, partial [bacterium]
NGDVMRSDRLKQVMQEIDSSFDEKDLGMAKFSRFVQDAVQRGLLSATKLENGQLEIGLPSGAKGDARAAENAAADEAARVEVPAIAAGDKPAGSRGRRGRRGRGRDRDDRPRAAGATELPLDAEAEAASDTVALAPEVVTPTPPAAVAPPAALPAPSARPERVPRPERPARPARTEVAEPVGAIGATGERLTRDEAFDLLRRTVAALTSGDAAVRAGIVRAKARELLGRDSESLSDRNFPRILKDAHDNDVIDLRRRGDDFEVARVSEAESVAEQLAKTAILNAPAPVVSAPAPRGMGPRGGVSSRGGRGGRPGAPPPELLSIGVVGPSSSAISTTPAAAPTPEPVAQPAPVVAIAEQATATAPTVAALPTPAVKSNVRKTAAKKRAPAAKTAAAKAPSKLAVEKAPAAKMPVAKTSAAREPSAKAKGKPTPAPIAKKTAAAPKPRAKKAVARDEA